MIIKKLLLSTLLTSAVLATSIAFADEVVNTPAQAAVVKKVTHKKVTHHKKHHNDAYSPAVHQVKQVHPQSNRVEEVVVFADIANPVLLASVSKTDDVSNGFTVKLDGKLDAQYGFINQKGTFKQPAGSSNLPQIEDDGTTTSKLPKFGAAQTNQNALAINGELYIVAEKQINDTKYGATIDINADTSKAQSGSTSTANQAFLYAQNNLGRFEVGSLNGCSQQMSISAANIAKGTGGIDGDYANWVSYGALGTVSPDLIVLDKTFLTDATLPYSNLNSKKSNGMNYYTPILNGFQVGLGYVPDVTTQGTVSEALAFKNTGFKNVVEGGLSYEQKTSDKMSFALSVTGQVGQARNFVNQTDSTITKNLYNLGAWQAGAKVMIDAVTLAASYGDWGKSGAVKAPLTDANFGGKKQTSYWTAGTAYTQDLFGMSLTYMNSKRQGAWSPLASSFISANTTFKDAVQKYESLSLGAEYKIVPGFMPYAEVTTFKYKSPLVNVQTNAGAIFLGGVKLHF